MFVLVKSKLTVIYYIIGDFGLVESDLAHGVAVAHGDCAVIERVEVDRHAVRRADLVLTAIPFAYRTGQVVGACDAALFERTERLSARSLNAF